VNELFDEIKEQHQFKTDTQLADFLLLSKAQVCLLRAGKKLSAYTLMPVPKRDIHTLCSTVEFNPDMTPEARKKCRDLRATKY
jgi:hypothetical protein